jgi:cysteine desulfurase
LRDHLITTVLAEIPDTQLNGDRQRRLPTNANFSFSGIEGEAILMSLDLQGIAVSTGSACNSSSQSSFVLKAMGIDPMAAQGCVRITLGEENTREDVNTTIEALKNIVGKLRKMSPVYKE